MAGPFDPSRGQGSRVTLLVVATVGVASTLWCLRDKFPWTRPVTAAPAIAGPSARGGLVGGAIVRLESRYEHPIWVVINDAAYRALLHAHRAGDVAVVQEVLRRGHAFAVDEDTEAQILGEGIEFYRIRLLEGTNQGRTGWVPAYNVSAVGLEREL
jgi:hypothetical protein